MRFRRSKYRSFAVLWISDLCRSCASFAPAMEPPATSRLDAASSRALTIHICAPPVMYRSGVQNQTFSGAMASCSVHTRLNQAAFSRVARRFIHRGASRSGMDES